MSAIKSFIVMLLIGLSISLYVLAFFLTVADSPIRGSSVTYIGWDAFQVCVNGLLKGRDFIDRSISLAGVLANAAVLFVVFSWITGNWKVGEKGALAALFLGLIPLTVFWGIVWNHSGYWVWLGCFVVMFIASRHAWSVWPRD